MGNTVSKVVDTGLRIACVATGGQFGLSDQGYHIGPVRVKKKSIGLSLNYGICNLNLKIAKSESGSFSLEGDATLGIPGVASRTLRAGVDSDAFYGGILGSLNVGPAKVNAGIVADSKGNIRSLGAGVTGPLLTNIQYSKEYGLSGGMLGFSVNKDEEISFAPLQDAVINKAGEKAAERYQSYRKEKQRGNEKKEESKSCDNGNKNKSNQRPEKTFRRNEKYKGGEKNKHDKTETAKLNNKKGSKSSQGSNIRLRTVQQKSKGTTDANRNQIAIALQSTEKLEIDRKKTKLKLNRLA